MNTVAALIGTLLAAILGFAAANHIDISQFIGGSGPPGGSPGPGGFQGAPGPLAAAGLPGLITMVGAWWAYRRMKRKS
jgi:hypothetical protein